MDEGIRPESGAGQEGSHQGRIVQHDGNGDRKPANPERLDLRGVVGVARADDAQLKGAAGMVVAAHDASLQGGAGAIVARGGVNVRGGAAPIIVDGGDMELKSGVAGMVVARKFTVRRGFVAVAVSPKVKVKEGGKVLISAMSAVLLGAAMGGAFALVMMLTREDTANRLRKSMKAAGGRFEAYTKPVQKSGKRYVKQGRRAMSKAMSSMR